MADDLDADKEVIAVNPLKIDLPPPTGTDEGFQDTPTPPPVNPGAESVRGTLSRGGEPFDPAIHQYPPTENKTSGKWRKRHKAIINAQTVNELPNANYRKEAEKTARLYAEIHRLIGDDAGLADVRELVPMTDAWEQYFNENGLKKMPAWAQILVSHGLYSYGVISRPTVWQRIKTTYYKLIGKKQNERSSIDSRQQHERENESSETTSTKDGTGK